MITPPTPAPATADLGALEQALESLTIARPAAAHVLAIIDDPNATAPRVASSVELDPGFATQLMRLANSAYYGLSGRVGNTSYAVTVLGFSAIRSLAALNAAGLDHTDRPKPAGFWHHAAATAAGCSAVASHFGLVSGDAFAAGLLHDLGLALLHGFDRDGHQRLIDQHGEDGYALASAEATTFGMSHASAAAHVLQSWNFPAEFVDAVAHHHDPSPAGSPLAQAVRIGDLLAQTPGDDLSELTEDGAELLVAAGLPEDRWLSLLEVTRARAMEIMAGLPVS